MYLGLKPTRTPGQPVPALQRLSLLAQSILAMQRKFEDSSTFCGCFSQRINAHVTNTSRIHHHAGAKINFAGRQCICPIPFALASKSGFQSSMTLCKTLEGSVSAGFPWKDRRGNATEATEGHCSAEVAPRPRPEWHTILYASSASLESFFQDRNAALSKSCTRLLRKPYWNQWCKFTQGTNQDPLRKYGQ